MLIREKKFVVGWRIRSGSLFLSVSVIFWSPLVSGWWQDGSTEWSVGLVIGIMDLSVGWRLVLDADLRLNLSARCDVHFGSHGLLWSLQENVNWLFPTELTSFKSGLNDLLNTVVRNNNFNGWGTSTTTGQPKDMFILECNVFLSGNFTLESVRFWSTSDSLATNVPGSTWTTTTSKSRRLSGTSKGTTTKVLGSCL